MDELPSGTVTFLFTDIEGSTRKWQQEPSMVSALARHDELLYETVEAHGGRVLKHTGDGAVAVFAAATDAIVAAAQAQRALRAEPWPGSPLLVRMAVHTGEAEERGGDYFGPALNVAARLMAAARGGQVLVSPASEQLARDRLPEGLSLEDRGEHRLKDIDRRLRVFELAGDGLTGDLLPLRTQQPAGSRPPMPRTSFVGREEQLDDLIGVVESHRLVTLTGPGGTGKTRLALEAAQRLSPSFRDQIAFVDLAEIDEDDAIATTVAASIDIPFDEPSLAESRILRALEGRSMLLLLDNCEHLLSGVARLVDRIVEECPNPTVLATSREALRVEGERVFPVPPLDREASIELFRRRAEAAAPGAVAHVDEAIVDDLCARLDRLPLAIELAAARLSHMSATEILQRLDQRFRLLTGGRTSLNRHETLQATLDWSHALLTSAEQAMFRSASVFVSGFDLAAACAVSGENEIESLDLLGSLVAKSLLRADPLEDGRTRYGMLESVRAYARERLEDRGETDTRLRAHADHFLERSLSRKPEPPDVHPWRRVWRQEPDRDPDRSNYELAVETLLAANRTTAAALLLARMVAVFALATVDTERRVLERPHVANTIDDAEERALYWLASALNAQWVGRLDDMGDLAARAVRLDANERTSAVAAGLLVQQASWTRPDEVDDLVAEALDRLPPGSPGLRLYLRERRADAMLIGRRFQEAVRLLQELHRDGSEWARYELLLANHLIGRDDDTRALLATLPASLEDALGAYRIYLARGLAALADDDLDRARRHIVDAAERARPYAWGLLDRDMLIGLAALAYGRGEPERASTLLAATGGIVRTPAAYALYLRYRDLTKDQITKDQIAVSRESVAGRDPQDILDEELARLQRA